MENNFVCRKKFVISKKGEGSKTYVHNLACVKFSSLSYIKKIYICVYIVYL